MVEVDTTEQRVYACLLVHGAPVFVRFENEAAYSGFLSDCVPTSGGSPPFQGFVSVTGFDNGDLLVRPASVDLVLKGAKPDGN